MKIRPFSFFFILFNVVAICSFAQKNESLRVNISLQDEVNKQPIEFGIVQLKKEEMKWEAISNIDGVAHIQAPKGKYLLSTFSMGYKEYSGQIEISSDTTIVISLSSSSYALNEIVVTASESKGMTSSSIIDTKAMQHLQPSSFTDLLELLPGGKSQDPNFKSMNAIKIREVGFNSEEENKYSVSSLGTSFVIDGAQISTDANMQYLTSEASGTKDKKVSSINRGVDMRSISTDQIEKVEIVRGIPSVKYGELTSGLVNIQRKKGATPWNGRLKVDGFSKLFAVNKGYNFNDKNLTLNFGVDFLDSNLTPTNTYERYQRFSYSVRLGKAWKKSGYWLRWYSNFDQAHTFDQNKVDPNLFDDVQENADIESMKRERYKSKYDKLSLSNTLSLEPKNNGIVKSIDFSTDIAYQIDKIENTKFVQLSSLTLTIPTLDETGIADGIYLPSKYVSEQSVEGKPLNLTVKASTNLAFTTLSFNHKVIAGIEYALDKNYGKGQIFDRETPPSGSTFYRPRDYSTIPSKQTMSFYAEDVISKALGNNLMKLSTGIRGTAMLGMDKRYTMNNKLYLDPRFNGEWSFPSISVSGKPLNISLGGGLGWLTKFPTLLQIYPDYTYNDYVRLNYYDVNNLDQSRVNYETFKTQNINYNLEPAKNRKWEVRLNLEYDNNNFSVTYFREQMNNGFRSEVMDNFSITTKKYYSDKDSIVIDPSANRPDLDLSKYKDRKYLRTSTATGNGTGISKEGIEFTISTKRLKSLLTRLTISGAWFKTKYQNTGVEQKSISQTLGGEDLQAVGLFDSTGGQYREQFNTNFTFDTYIPTLGFEFSTSFQCQWFTISNKLYESRYPFAYIDMDGITHAYTEESKTDPLLKLLTRESNPSLFKKARVPFGMDVNLKASKNIQDIIRISLFVNKLIDCYPVYKVNGAEIRRSQKPYFGMEMSITI